MKVEILLVSFVLSMLHIQCTSAKIRPAMPTEVYKHLVRNGATTLKSSMKDVACRFFGRSQSCQLAKKNRNALDHLSDLYLVRRNIIPIEHNIDLNVQNSPLINNYNLPTTQAKRLVRVKRSIPGNPCTRTYAFPMVHFYGVDVLEKQVVEILHNPASEEFQSFFTFSCARKAFNGMLCEPSDMEYMAAVFVDIDQVGFRRIRLPTTCTLTVGSNG